MVGLLAGRYFFLIWGVLPPDVLSREKESRLGLDGDYYTSDVSTSERQDRGQV